MSKFLSLQFEKSSSETYIEQCSLKLKKKIPVCKKLTYMNPTDYEKSVMNQECFLESQKLCVRNPFEN